jgi:DNA-binding CsgD family transcriptional regulator
MDRVPPAVGIRSAHGHLARALEAQHPAPSAREIAAQWQAAGDVERFARWAIAASEEARGVGDLKAQVALLEHLLTRWDEPGVARAAGVPWVAAALALVAALRLAGQPHKAVTMARSLLRDPRVVYAEDRVAALVELGGALTETADPEARTTVTTALSEVRQLSDTPRSTRLLALAAGSFGNFVGEQEAATPAAEAAERAAQWGLDDVVARADTTVGSLLAASDPAAATAAFERARAAAERMADVDPLLLLRYYTNVGDALRIQGRADLAAAVTTTGLTWAVDQGYTDTSGAHLAATLAEALFDAGRLEEAAHLIKSWLPRATAERERWWLIAIRGRVELAAGNPTAASSSMASIVDATQPELLPHSPAIVMALLRCELAARTRSDSTVVHHSVESARAMHTMSPVTALELLALASSRLGTTPQDLALEQEIDRLARALQPRVHPQVAAPWNAIAHAWRAAPGTAESAASWNTALAASREALPFVWRVRTLLAAAHDAIAAGRNARAKMLLTASLELVDAAGALAWSHDINAIETRLRPSTPEDWERLSPREIEVLRHLATGATNDATAQALAISARTVEVHVAHVLHKLEATSRGAAVAAAVQRGILDEDDLRRRT